MGQKWEMAVRKKERKRGVCGGEKMSQAHSPHGSACTETEMLAETHSMKEEIYANYELMGPSLFNAVASSFHLPHLLFSFSLSSLVSSRLV